MKFDMEAVLQDMSDLINTPSVVGYYPQIHQAMEEKLAQLGLEAQYDNRHTLYVKIPGKDSSKTVCLGAHLDTIGMVVTAVEPNGWLKVRSLGGLNFHSLEGENVFVHTRFDGDYTGTVICKSHSVHVFDDARELERTEKNMRIVLDEDVHSKQEVKDLGIRPGDLISVEPRFMVTESGYIKSRHVDDKASAAVLLECLRQIVNENLVPQYNTWFAFPIFEEIGLGGAYVPEEVSEYLALDIGLVDGDQNGDEKKVTISACDRKSPYDWEGTSRLISLAEANGIDYAVDAYYRYGSDATAAVSCGNNVIPLTIGMGCLSSHGYERTHLDGVEQTIKLSMAYILG